VNGLIVHKGGANAGMPFDTRDAMNINTLDESAIFKAWQGQYKQAEVNGRARASS
jgi:hypothetical protein